MIEWVFFKSREQNTKRWIYEPLKYVPPFLPIVPKSFATDSASTCWSPRSLFPTCFRAPFVCVNHNEIEKKYTRTYLVVVLKISSPSLPFLSPMLSLSLFWSTRSLFSSYQIFTQIQRKSFSGIVQYEIFCFGFYVIIKKPHTRRPPPPPHRNSDESSSEYFHFRTGHTADSNHYPRHPSAAAPPFSHNLLNKFWKTVSLQ